MGACKSKSQVANGSREPLLSVRDGLGGGGGGGDEGAADASTTARSPYMTFKSRGAIDRALERRRLARPPPPSPDEPAESEPLLDRELGDAAEVRAKLSPRALELAEGARSYHGLRRAVRGYWTYPDRVNEMARCLAMPLHFRLPT